MNEALRYVFERSIVELDKRIEELRRKKEMLIVKLDEIIKSNGMKH
ncbi:UNVERIFIED_ORG: hypothetical protein ABRZ91_001784 [Heyndrickxia coagulans]